ncbi:DUF4412 domain-containing protein [Limisalsivibrio acetivorans]|uniref:DUF4412 domain-containing protein n=1 Tax=Limisalsivibrio acetivorans TaxID=1304888 RepID=UPI0003B585B9|nr:DUF4412 domain-containing protein [Limisalsivibrio acetivorans]
MIKGIVTAVCAVLFSAYAFAGVAVFEKISGTDGVTYYEDGKVAAYENGRMQSLIDTGAGVIYTIDHENRRVAKGTFQEMEQVSRQAQKAMDAMMADPQMGAMMKKRQEALKSIKVNVKKKGTRDIAGYPCTEYVFTADVQGFETVGCYSGKLMDKISKEIDSGSMKKLMEMTGGFMETGVSDIIEKKTMEYSLEGFTLYEKTTVNTGGVTDSDESVVTKIEEKSIPGSRFDLPQGYSTVSMMELFGAGM